MNTRQKAESSCCRFDAVAIEKGMIPCKPLVYVRYDRVLVGQDGKMLKVQIKYADSISSRASGSFQVNLRTFYNGKKASDGYSSNEIDALAVYVASIGKFCWFDVSVIEGRSALCIRTEPTKNGQLKGVMWYEDYLW